jgi:chromate reductase
MTRILLVSGSTHDRSLPSAALRTAAGCAPAEITAARFDGLRDLPAFVPAEPGEDRAPGAVELLRRQVGAAGALLFCTPEYAGSLPGSLKNLLDWLVAGGDLVGKPVAWLSVAAPGQDDGACATLETVLGHGNAEVVRPACLRVPLDPGAVDAEGLVDDPQLRTALQDLWQTLARSLTIPKRQQPSWQAYSSVYPVLSRPQSHPTRFGHPPRRS